MKQIANIPNAENKRVVIIGSGFAGMKLAMELKKEKFQVVVIDKKNYHQFQPLLYQVATAGLEPTAISFPLRKLFQNHKNLIFRIGTLKEVDHDKKQISQVLEN